MARIQQTFAVALPATEVFDYVADFTNTAEWDPAMRGARTLTDGVPVGAGSRFEVDVSLAIATLPLVYEIVHYERPGRVTLKLRHDRLVGRDDVRITEVEGVSHVRWDAEFGVGGGLGRVIDPVWTPAFRIVGRRAVASLEATLAARDGADVVS